MASESVSGKDGLRLRMRGALRGLPLDRGPMDSAIMDHAEGLLGSLGEFGVAGYSAMSREPDLGRLYSRLLACGHPLYLPRYVDSSGLYEMVEVKDIGRDLRPGRYGILEPDSSLPGMSPPFVTCTPWVWFVPALGYDLAGHRLGHGGGYYDRLLAGANGVKVGIAYDCQLVDVLPFEEHDAVMDYVVTESQLRNC